MLLRVLSVVLLLNGVASFVLFTHSVLYDTQDFFDNRNITLPSFCSTSGCHVYVAPMPDNTVAYAKNIKIFSQHIAWDNNDLYYISTGYQATGAKAPDVLSALRTGDSYFIENMNDADPFKDHPAMLTVYVVSMTAPNLASSLVFDSNRDIPNPLPAPIIMLMDNFMTTLAISSSSSANSVVLRTVGFDNADGMADGCNYVLDTKSSGTAFSGVEEQLVNTQIITMKFDNVNNVAIKRGTLLTWNYYLDSAPFTGFITSAGHIGCSKATNNDELYSIETLRSGNFPPDTFYYLISKEYIMNVHFEWDLNVLPDYPVVVTSNGAATKYAGTNHKQSTSSTSETENVKIEWERYNTGSFMARFTTEPVIKVTDPYARDTTTSKGASNIIVPSVLISMICALIH